LKNRIARIFLYLIFEIGALCGVPMRPDQIEREMQIQQRPEIRRRQDSST
jgi:hypothetical protein